MNQKYIWQLSTWPNFRWDNSALIDPLGACRFQQGYLLAKMRDLGFETQEEARAEILVEEALKTSEIEGQILDPKAVRSSVAKRLGLPSAGLPEIRNPYAEGTVDILLDATVNYNRKLTAERLFGWHAALFPTGYSGMHKIRVARWRDDREGAMRVVSGAMGRETVHYEAPPANRLAGEMEIFLSWWEKSLGGTEGVLRAGMAHLWFVTIHPFEDGNGRIARTLTDMALAQDEGLSTRFYSLSSRIMANREIYYDVLEQTQKGNGDITEWLKWFIECITRSAEDTGRLLSNILKKAEFWRRHAQTDINERQRKVINRMLDAGPGGFEGGMKNRKYAGMTKVSRATAQRELADLVKKGVMRPNPGGGRSANYDLVWE